MTTFEVFRALYGHDTFWIVVSLSMLVCGIAVGHELGKEHRQPRDAKGRYVPAKR